MSDLIQHDSNFAFLQGRDARLARLGAEAELLASINPNTCIMQVRLIAELLAKRAAAELGVYDVDDLSFFQTLERLQRFNQFGRDIRQVFHDIRQDANEVVHGNQIVDAKGVARHYVKLAHKSAVWFYRTLEDPSFSPGAFQSPPDYEDRYVDVLAEHEELEQRIKRTNEVIEEVQTRARTESQRRAEAEEIASQLREERDVYESLAHEYEDEITRLRAELEQRPTTEREAEQSAQLERMQSASDLVELDEDDTRHHIDAQLRQHGWQADSAALRWGKGARPETGVARAIAEVPTGSGPADYVLFDGLTPLAAVEAKRWEQDVAGSLDQARRYARDYDISDEQQSPGGPWTGAADDYVIPFAFATNGRTFMHQIERRSGIWFDDLRRPRSIERPLAGWYTPDGLCNLLDKDVDAALAMLREEPMRYLSLRDYQQEAVQAIEATRQPSATSSASSNASSSG